MSTVQPIIAATFACAAAVFFPVMPTRQVEVVPGTFAGGEQVFRDKGCISCHSLNGKGGTSAPEFAGLSRGSNKPGFLAGEIWNHAPSMFAEFEAQGRDVPSMTSTEAGDLYAYFYGALYFAPKGDANRGRNVFEDKRCVSCHSDVLRPGPIRPAIDQWPNPQDPIAWAERMWNHANEMASATANRGIDWPDLSERDAVDLLMFLSRVPETASQNVVFAPGDAGLGRAVFEESCATCHSFGPEKSKIDLRAFSKPSSMAGYVATMWNHAPIMRKRGGHTVHLKTGDMRDLIAFLFSQKYFYETGDAKRGRKVYEAKECITCHEHRRVETSAPDLTRTVEAYSPITLTAAVWRHGPQMLKAMRRQKMEWPEFEKTEMADLIAYLNSRVIVRIAPVVP